MSINIRYPNITAGSEREQMAQMRSYLHQLVDQLNYAFSILGEGTQEGCKECETVKEDLMHEINQLHSKINRLESSEEE